MTVEDPTAERRVRILVADEDPALRDLLTRFSEAMPGFSVVGRSDSISGILHELRITAFDLLIVDVQLLSKTIGLELIRKLRERRPGIKILAVGKAPQYERETFFSGANGFLMKPFRLGELTEAVATVLDGRLYYRAELLRGLPRTPAVCTAESWKLPEQLTEDDRTYIHARLAGKSDLQIAEDLQVKLETISRRRHRIVQRLGLDTDLESFILRLVNWQTLPRQEGAAG